MEYADFTLESAEATLGVTSRMGDLFPALEPAPVPAWLADLLEWGMRLALVGEKARSEYIVAPILLAVREAAGDRIAILSGQRLDVDPERRLMGECDFLLARSEPVPRLRAPLMAVVEAKKQDIEGGLGQCVAQMVAAQVYNDRAGQPMAMIYGCVTTGETWQFLGLAGDSVTLHRPRIYIDAVGTVLAAFGRAVGQGDSACATAKGPTRSPARWPRPPSSPGSRRWTSPWETSATRGRRRWRKAPTPPA